MFIFIFATAGLLIWAAVKPWVERGIEVSELSHAGVGWAGDLWLMVDVEREGAEGLYTDGEPGGHLSFE